MSNSFICFTFVVVGLEKKVAKVENRVDCKLTEKSTKNCDTVNMNSTIVYLRSC